MSKKTRSIFQLKVTLQESKPSIWRRILVPDDMTLGHLHEVLQVAMGWTDNHLHQFVARGEVYGIPEIDDDGLSGRSSKDENKEKLSNLLGIEKDFLIYDYDFGDNWEHKITLEKIAPFDSSVPLPSCIKGKRACPPEDCGGVWGYQDLIAIMSDKSHPEHKDMLEWLGEFDPEFFDQNAVNALLAEHFR
jgi:hypothetical protein